MPDQKPHEDAIREGDPPYFGNKEDCPEGPDTDTTRIALPVDGARRFAGIALLVLGLALIGPVLWLGAFYHEGFGEVEWIRSFGLLAVGTWFCLAGYCLAYRPQLLTWALILGFAAPCLFALAMDLLRLVP
jgi:hypothetical protein